ncbi:MAG: hypothetical protein AAF441_05005 [Pseudomonadota bacterium]
MNWRVERIAIELLEDGDEKYFGINQTQAKEGRKMADGSFYAEVWSEDRQTRIIQDLDQGLPPLGSYEPHLVQAASLSPGKLFLKCYCEQDSAESWHPLVSPAEGWAGRMVQVYWAEQN